ncbi:hypothetical protein AAFF_G00060050 [Aldrovandia affinis]|uniref:Uncharacterized protein n=1 Tax=Aldrovandia affinis TaxID=143900 RepID=A0AAD7S0G5_9TELE|nr:hypothetical protein AAFF_G00060050 [Aldrovandia affinis]
MHTTRLRGKRVALTAHFKPSGLCTSDWAPRPDLWLEECADVGMLSPVEPLGAALMAPPSQLRPHGITPLV